MNLPLCKNTFIEPHRIEHPRYVDRYGGFCYACAGSGMDDAIEEIDRLRHQHEQDVIVMAHIERQRRDLLAELAALKRGKAVVAVHHATEDTHDRPPGCQRV
jgi:hypothetical protein